MQATLFQLTIETVEYKTSIDFTMNTLPYLAVGLKVFTYVLPTIFSKIGLVHLKHIDSKANRLSKLELLV